MKEFKPRDKLTQRMTRDGAVLDNQTTGEEIHISERDAEKQLSPNGQPVQMGKRDAPMNPAEDAPKHGRQLRPQEQKEPEKDQPKPQQPSAEPFQPQSSSPISHIPQDIPTSAAPGGTAEKLFDRAAAEHDAHKARQAARMSRDAAQQRYSASRLQFSEEERAAPELHKHIHRAEKAADKLDAAQAAIPKKRVLRKERVFDEASGTAKTKLRFDTVDKYPPKLKPNPLGRPLREVAVQAHGKIHEVEHENVGVESGHKAEELAEHGAGGAIRWERRHRKLKPYRAAEKAERKALNANAEYLYQKALHDNPEMLSGNPLNRFFQKQRLKREYAKAARTAKAAGSTAQATAKSAEKTAEATATAAKKAAEKAKEAAEFVARHWKGVLVVLAGFLLIVMLIGGLQSCSALVGAAGGGVAASSYQSEDADILAAEAAYCALEAELQEYLDTYERTHDYDEYHYDLDEIKHDPYVLASILSALHDGAWTASEVQGTLQMLFEKQYILTETVVTEVRYRTVTRTDSEGNEYEVEVPYNYYICTVELENFDLSHIPVYIMDEEALSKYALYMSVLGNKPELFGDSEYIPKYITNRPEGYEIPPSAMEDETFAAVITEAEKYLGYPYVWGGSSPSTSFDCSGFVSWVLTNSGVCNTGRLQGLSVKRLFFYVIIGLILSMTVAAAILYFITEQSAVLAVGAVLILCALAWLLALTQILGKKLALFTSDLCGTLDNMIAGNKGISLSEDSETQLARIGHRLARLYQIMQEDRRRVEEDRQELQSLVSDISHQVKTPVSNLKMATDTLLEKPITEAERTDFIRGIRTQTDKLDFLFQALVKTSRLETGVIQLDKKVCNLYDTVAQAMSGIVYAAEKKEISVSVNCPEKLMLSHDSKWTAEALFNLLDNAVKYTSAGGKISVSVVQWEMYVEIKVADNGKGISESNQAAIFRRFYRGEEVHSEPGVGIGLYLAREIITRQGGYIKVVSAPGNGSAFSIMLPAK